MVVVTVVASLLIVHGGSGFSWTCRRCYGRGCRLGLGLVLIERPQGGREAGGAALNKPGMQSMGTLKVGSKRTKRRGQWFTLSVVSG